MRILFWGTSSFAVPSLRALIGEGFDVVGVVTQPDRPVGRSRSRLVAPPVKEIAATEGVPVLQPERPRGEPFVREITALDPEISVVVSYGHILTEEIIALPPRGTINVHASLLPKLRGASPIRAAIRDGFLETGVTVMRMVPALDAGPIVLQARTPVAEDETFGELELRLSELGALALVEALTLLELGQASEREQDDAAATYAGKIAREMARIDWREGCGVVARHIRAYDPHPGAFTTLHGAELKLFGAMATDAAGDEGAHVAGEILALDDGGMLVATGDGAVRVTDVQPAGKRRIAVAAWARGRGGSVGDRFGTER
ncbi:MAG TPA: methionyl-tRNA formyltransferase [Gemmatimonadaceae bacterium]|nr:methionyl-tRNA formyltransferase [Gemmatimonadaceae bacterium]